MLSLIITTSLFVIFLVYMKLPDKLPPGPRGYPIVGNLFELKQGRIRESLKNLRTKFGDIFCLRVVDQKIIIVNGIENLREVFVKRSHLTSDRPNTFIRIIADGLGIIGSSGKLWHEQRSFAQHTLRGFGLGKRCFESHIMEELERFIANVEATKGVGFDIRCMSTMSIANNICSLVFGRTFDQDDTEFLRILELINGHFVDPRTGILHFLPFLRHTPGDLFGYKSSRRSLQEIQKFLEPMIQEHRRTLDQDNIRDYIDAFLLEQIRQSDNSETTFTVTWDHDFTDFYIRRTGAANRSAVSVAVSLSRTPRACIEPPDVTTDAQLKMTIQNLFIAGTETTATVLRWAVLFLIRHQDVQSKMRTEIDDVIGTAKFPSVEQKTKLPYCEAVITESLRLAGIATLTLPHAIKEEFTYKGYTFPKGAILFGSLISDALNPQVFPDPEKFDPDRFLDKSGELTGCDQFVPFSLGRRVCLGESLARMELFLFLVTLVQRFELLPVDNKSKPPLQGEEGGATFSPRAYELRAVKRT